MSDIPVTTVVIPTAGRFEFLREAIDSVLSQTETSVELIVSDNSADPDYSRKLEELKDRGFTLVHQSPACSMAEHANRLTSVGSGKYWLYLPDDDVLLPNCLGKLVEALESHPTAGIAFCDHWIMDTEGNRLQKETDSNSSFYARADLAQGLIPNERLLELALRQAFELQSTLFRTSLIRNLGFDINYELLPDYDLQVRAAISDETGDAVYVAERLTAYRMHDAQFTGSANTQQFAEQLLSMVNRLEKLEGCAERYRKAQVAHAHRLLARCAAENGRRIEGLTHVTQAFLAEPSRLLLNAIAVGTLLAPRSAVALARRARNQWKMSWAKKSRPQNHQSTVTQSRVVP